MKNDVMFSGVICLSVSLFLYLSAKLLEFWTDFDEIFGSFSVGQRTKWLDFSGDSVHDPDSVGPRTMIREWTRNVYR